MEIYTDTFFLFYFSNEQLLLMRVKPPQKNADVMYDGIYEVPKNIVQRCMLLINKC